MPGFGTTRRRPWLLAGILFLALPRPSWAEGAPFRRGDVNGIGGPAEALDAVHILRYLFQGATWLQVPCLDAADSNDDGHVSVTDAIYILAWVHFGGPAPPPPFDACGLDPTEDGLDCEKTTCTFVQVAMVGAEAVVFVVEGSKGMLDRGDLKQAKLQVLSALHFAPSGIRVSVHFYASDVWSYPFSGEPAPLSEEGRDEAVAFVNGVQVGQGSCPHLGLLAALDSVDATPPGKSAVILLGHGTGECFGTDEREYLQETLATVSRENAGLTRIHTLAILNVSRLGLQFLQDLATRNGGEYEWIVR